MDNAWCLGFHEIAANFNKLLAPLVVEALRGQIGALREEGLSIVLAEQNLDLVLALADRIYFLEKGQIRYTATPAEVRADPELIRRYLIV